VRRAAGGLAHLHRAVRVSAAGTEPLRARLRLASEMMEWLEQRAAEEGAPREAIFVAAVAALLGRYTGRDDIAFGVRSAGRDGSVHLRLDGEPDAWQLLGRAAIALASFEPGEDAGALVELRAPGASEPVRVVVQLEPDEVPASADLLITVDGQALELVFRPDCFEAVAAPRIAQHLRALVLGLATATGPVSAIPIVHGEERAWLLERSNATRVDLEESLPTIVECFERRAREMPEAIAVVDGDRELSYHELDVAADALRDGLRARGVGAGSRVATYLPRGADAIIAFLAILKARGTYVPIDMGYPPARVAAILASAAPRLVLTQLSSAAAVEAVSEGDVPIELYFIDDAPVSGAPRSRPVIRPDDAAYCFFTSGSTGRPKGVVVDHRALANYARAAADAYGVGSTDRVLQAASLGFDLSLEEIVITLTAGATLVVRSAGPIESVQAFFEECTEQRLTILSITSALWHELTLRLADRSVSLPPLIRLVILGADVARADVLPAWQRATLGRVRLINSYGLTETTIVATIWEAGAQPLSGGSGALPIGRPLRNVSAYVLDARGELLPVGVAGEICIGGQAVARGYLNDDEQTRARFVPDPFVRGGWMYRSGDRGAVRSNGELEFLGRADYRVKVQGVRIELGEIEARLREHDGVVEAVAVAKTGATGDTELDAHVMVSSADVTSGMLTQHLRATLPPAAVPARVYVVDRFPLTPAGKIDRRALASGPAQVERTPFVAARTALERLVTTTTAEVLGVDQVGLRDGFLALGGTSLSAVRAASVLGPRLGRRLAAQLFLECATLADLCSALERPAQDPAEAERASEILQRDAILPSDLRAQGPRQPPGAALESVLLTGATGYYGTFLLAELLRQTPAHIVCLVRAPSVEAARERVLERLSRRGCHIDPDVLATRVSWVTGDVARPMLDLAPEVYRSTSESVDAVIHAAARVSMLLPYEALKASNALSVEHILRFAVAGKPKTVHHVSTVEVLADMDRHDPLALTERAVAASPGPLEGGYGQSKWVAEKLVEQARERGIRAYIHRPGRLTGHSLSGAFNGDDFLVQLLDACGRIGAAPMLDVVVDVTPVDAAARALVRLVESEPKRTLYHLVHPSPPSWGALVETAVAIGYPLRLVPHSRWRSMLQDLTRRDERPTFLHYLASLSGEEIEELLRGGHATQLTSSVLTPSFSWPAIDAHLLSTYLRAMADAGRFPLGRSPRVSSGVPSSRRSQDKFPVVGR
jgi:amino acid adenylation domain-containing protein/thioester reductase-like protein